MSADLSLTARDIQRVLLACGLRCGADLAEGCSEYLRLMQKWNQKINLTGIGDPREAVRTLFAESFYGADLLNEVKGSILDIGSGAGFPGLAMKLRRPEFDTILLEPRRKRCAFLSAVCRELTISGVRVLNRTLEQCRSEDFLRRPEVITLRAVGNAPGLVSRALGLTGASPRALLFLSTRQVTQVQAELKEFHCQTEFIPWNTKHCLLLGQPS
jgi:16S rRNA (guanine(527)-N(7))-methyltransferase RsmG